MLEGGEDALPEVWLVEDSALECERARRVLEGHCVLEVFAEGPTMLERLALGVRPALVVLDLNLPGIPGIELLRFLRAQLDAAELPVLMLTVAGSKADVVESLQAGANDYVTKPYDPAELLARVTSQLRTQQLHQRLRHAEEGFRRLAAHLPDVVARFDRQHRHTFVSPSIRRFTTEPVEHFLGKTNAELGMPAERVRQWEVAIDEAFTGREVALEFEFPGTGGRRVVQSRLLPERDDRGNVLSVLSIARDVTEERMRAEHERHLIGIVSHDLKNPLAAILMQVQVGLVRGGGDAATRDILERIRRTATRATGLVSDLLDFTRTRLGGGLPLATRLQDLRDVLGQVLEELRIARPDRQLRWEVEGETSLVADGERLAQLVTNLVANALQYSPRETEVRVRLEGQAEAVVLTVHNQGAPIPAEVLARLFEPFQRASAEQDRSGRNVGLGLYIVHQIARAHGGQVTVRSSQEDGTTFAVRLPRVRDTASQ
ncbi:sensor histidine kinase [Corallococcus llansteffanensis]|uniref:sensor histidine kinase n=1 Tax=Corallococcus llansteffanensis TaxID=2316731 RepID=UPI0013153B11|nr:ATP-binding protein [Corallococcus llansteffanensis]